MQEKSPGRVASAVIFVNQAESYYPTDGAHSPPTKARAHYMESPVEVPVYRFTWEGYHSELNQVSSVYVPAPALCDW